MMVQGHCSNTGKVTQQNRQVPPPVDEFITVPDLPTITHRQKYSPQPIEEESSNTPDPEQDHALRQTDPQREYRPLLPVEINQHPLEDSATTPTSIQEVQLLLGTTPHENQ